MSPELRTGPIAPEATMHRRTHPIKLYGALIVAVVLANLTLFFGGLMSGWWQPHAHSLQLIAAISQMNLLCSILPRQHWMVNLISATATRVPVTWPRLLRQRLAQYY